MSKRIIDLSCTIENFAYEPWPPKITYWDHAEEARNLAGMMGIRPEDFPDGHGLAWEELTLITHVGTHLDAPWHFGPTSGGKKSRTIDEIPLEWCISDGVVIDVRHKKQGESITLEDTQNGLAKIGYQVKPFDIVLFMTGADKYIYDVKYSSMHPGVSAEATSWLIDQGVVVMGIDGYGFDKPFSVMAQEFKDGAGSKALWPAHFVSREKEYLHIEKLVNLDKIPKPFGFQVSCLPVKIAKASAGWIRAVAIVED